MVELKMRDENGEPLLDICDIADMNETLLIRHHNQRMAEKQVQRDSKDKKKAF